MNIVFVEPAFPQNQRRFVAALAGVGARVVGVGESPEHELGDELRGQMAAYYQVRNVTDVHQLDEAVQWAQDQMWIDRLESTIESHQMAAAEVREARGIPGTTLRTTWLCRDKPSMKDALRKAGVPTAASTAADSAAEVARVRPGDRLPADPQAPQRGRRAGHRPRRLDGRPRPRAGRLRRRRARSPSRSSSRGTRASTTPSPSTATVVHDWATHYYPNVLEAMRHRWISPQFITTNRISDSPFYDEVREMGQRVIEALGITTSATHMEWFYGPKGLRFSEIGCRPPGVGAWDLYSAANDVDVYREWAHAIVHGGPENADDAASTPPASSPCAPTATATSSGYSGLDDVNWRFGEWIIDAHLPDIGTATQPVEAGYMANAWVRLRHPDYDTARSMLDDVGRTVRVHAG